nr:reverse transcriptase domain-containing protein [Tanacetum cinerariifolium]
MSTHSRPSPTAPTSAVRNTVGKGKEILQENMNGPASDAALREYCDKHCNQLLPILAEKMHQEKVQQEKLKVVKDCFNFEEVLQHFESGTPSRRRDLRRRLRSKYVRSVSGSPEPRRGRSESPMKRGPKRKTMFKRLEKGVFYRIGDKENVGAILRESVPMRALFSYRGPNTQDCWLFLQRRVFSHGHLYVSCFKSLDEKIKGDGKCRKLEEPRNWKSRKLEEPRRIFESFNVIYLQQEQFIRASSQWHCYLRLEYERSCTSESAKVYYECKEPFKSLKCLWVRSKSIAATWLEKVVTPLIEPAIKSFAAASAVLKPERQSRQTQYE